MRKKNQVSTRCLTGCVLMLLLTLIGASVSFAAENAPAAQPPAGHASMPARKKPAAVPASKLVDINSANREKLKTLPGIGDAEADRIIAGRPYLTKEDLAVNKVLPTGVYLSIKRLIIAKQTGKPNLKK
jgi:DNA uptake protein ComE-like DNA-binding protein